MTARLRKPQDGLFMGTVDAYDTSNNTYRIRFDRTGLGGTHSVRDEEVLSVDPAEAVPLSSFMQRVVRPRPQPAPPTQPYSSVFASPVKPSAGSVSYSGGWGIHYSPQLANDPLLSGSTPRGKVTRDNYCQMCALNHSKSLFEPASDDANRWPSRRAPGKVS